jgi:hypothetical protein
MIANLDPLITIEFDLELQCSYADARAILIKRVKLLTALGDPYMKGARTVASLHADTTEPSSRAAPSTRRPREDAPAAATAAPKKPRPARPCRFGLKCHRRRCLDDHPAGWTAPVEVATATTAPVSGANAETRRAEPRRSKPRAVPVLGDIFAPASRCILHADLAVPHTNGDCKAAGHPKNHYTKNT